MTPAYPVALVAWRAPPRKPAVQVLLHPALVAALDLPLEIFVQGGRCGARTWADQAALRAKTPTLAARGLSWHQAGLAVDLSPSSHPAVAAIGFAHFADRSIARPIVSEPWHVEGATPWRGNPSRPWDEPGARVGVACAIAELGPAWWDVTPGAPYPWARAAVMLAQGYLARLGLLRWSGVDGLLGPVTRAAIEGICPTFAPVGSTIEENVLVALAKACAERGV
jgi:hypothetical protein